MNDGKCRVLVIDDDADVRGLIKSLLEFEGFEVAVAADGNEGLELQKQNPAAVVVTDIFMPGKEGIETIVELKRKYPLTSIVVVSGGMPLTGTDYGPVARHLGAVVTLKKPFQFQELAAVVRRLSRSPDRRQSDRRDGKSHHHSNDGSSENSLSDRRDGKSHHHSNDGSSENSLSDRRLRDRRESAAQADRATSPPPGDQ